MNDLGERERIAKLETQVKNIDDSMDKLAASVEKNFDKLGEKLGEQLLTIKEDVKEDVGAIKDEIGTMKDTVQVLEFAAKHPKLVMLIVLGILSLLISDIRHPLMDGVANLFD